MEHLIRRARTAELGEIGELTVAAYEEYLTDAEDDYRHHLLDASARDQEAELWVAEAAGRLVGTVTYCPPGSPWRELATAEEGEFRMLAVHPTARGQGVGGSLAQHCEVRARAHGHTGMVLSTLATMRAAHHIYESLGYARAPERDWAPAPEVHLIAYAKTWGRG